MSTLKQLSSVTKALFVMAGVFVAILAWTIVKTADAIATPACKSIIYRTAETDAAINEVKSW